MTLVSDPIINVIHDGIKEPIRLLIAECHFPAALALIYSGIDTMAYLGLPEGSNKVKGVDFEEWCDRYIQFPGRENVSGLELYGARCGILHTHSATSSLSRSGKVREIFYDDKANPPVLSNKEDAPDTVIVSISALMEVFFSGVDRFLVDVFADERRAVIANERLESLLHLFRVSDKERNNA